jgi:hypothetical protein
MSVKLSSPAPELEELEEMTYLRMKDDSLAESVRTAATGSSGTICCIIVSRRSGGIVKDREELRERRKRLGEGLGEAL